VRVLEGVRERTEQLLVVPGLPTEAASIAEAVQQDVISVLPKQHGDG
jgi:hypothetical protein